MLGYKIKKWRVGDYYWLLTLLILAFVGSNDGFDDYPLVIFHIYGAKYIYQLMITAFFLGLICISKKSVSVDIVFFLLLAKSGLDFFSSYMVNGVDFQSNWYFFICTDLGVVFYFLCYNIQYDLKRIVACYRVFAIILSFQVFAVFLYYAGACMLISDEAYKGSMRIPFAASNVIASAIIPAVLCIFCTQHKKKIIGVLEILIYMFALVLLKSRGAILIFAILAEIYIILLIFKIKNIMNRWIVGTLFILLNMLGVWIILHSSFFYTYFGGFRGFSSLNDITSRRVEVWQYSLEEFFKKPIFGRGLYYDETNFIGSTGSHNIILETLMNCGIASAILHICIIVKLLWTNVRNIVSRKVSFHRINQARLSIVVVLVTLYANSMIEASYYNYINDVIFWSLAGFLKRDWIESASCEMMVGHKEETMGYLEAKR